MKTYLLKAISKIRYLALLMFLTLVSTHAWGAEEVVYTLTPASGSGSSYTGNCDVEIDGITWNITGNSTMQPWRIGGKSLTKVDRTVYSKTTLSDNVTKVVLTVGTASSITVNSLKLIVASDANFNTKISEVSGTFKASSDITFNRPNGKDWSNAYYKFVFNVTVSSTSNKYVQFSEAKFYAEAGASCTTPTASWSTAPADGTAGGNMNATLTTNYASGVVYSSSNTSVATVSGNGTTTCAITYVAAGTARITATVTGNGSTYCTGPATCYTDITISAAGGGGGGDCDVLNRAFTGVTNGSTSYSAWSNKSGSSSDAVYAGNSAGGNDAIQLRSTNSNSGIVTTTSGGTASSISVTWNSNTSSGRTLDIYGKNSVYSAATDLYSTSTQGTKLGSIVCGTSTSLSITGSYEYIGLRSNSGAMYLDEIDICWETCDALGAINGSISLTNKSNC